MATRGDAALRQLEARFAAGLPLSLAEATRLLDAREAAGAVDDTLRRRVLTLLHPTIGELIPAHERPLHHGEGTRWLTYWQGRSGWALVAVCREPGSTTPIHAHSHQLLAKTIEGAVEELRFRRRTAGGDHRAAMPTRRLVETSAPRLNASAPSAALGIDCTRGHRRRPRPRARGLPSTSARCRRRRLTSPSSAHQPRSRR